MNTATEYATGLRDLADWIEAHPEVSPELYKAEVNAFPNEDAENVKTWALAMSPCAKDYWSESANLFTLRRKFGPVTLEATFNRSAVCERVVTGTEEVTNLVPDPSVYVPLVEVTETREIVEWVCAPILEEVPA